MNSPRKPSVLFVFYTHTEQSRRVADAMASVMRERGCDVWIAGIEFTDPRYAAKFDRFPFRHAVLDLLAVLPAQVRRSTGQIRVPDVAREGDYDLVCLGSPTWFFTTNMPLRSYLKSAEAALLEHQPEGSQEAGYRAGGRVRRRHPFPVRGRPRQRPRHTR